MTTSFFIEQITYMMKKFFCIYGKYITQFIKNLEKVYNEHMWDQMKNRRKG